MSCPTIWLIRGKQKTTLTYGEGGDSTTDTPNSPPWSLLPYMYPSAPESGYLTYWLRNSSFKNAWTTSYLDGSNGEQLVYHYIFGDPKRNAKPRSPGHRRSMCIKIQITRNVRPSDFPAPRTMLMDTSLHVPGLAARPTRSCCTNLPIFMPVITHRGM